MARYRSLALVFLLLPLFSHADLLPLPGLPPCPPGLCGGPLITGKSIASSNASTTVVGASRTVTLSFTSDQSAATTPVVTIGGHSASATSTNGLSWTASVTMASGDTEGAVTFSANVVNTAGTASTIFSSTSDGSSVYFDATPPVITLSGTSTLSLTVGDPYTDAGASATDSHDGTVAVVTTGSVSTSTAGVYTLVYNATDAAGNAAIAVQRTVTVRPAPTPDPAPESTPTPTPTSTTPAPAPTTGGGGGNGPVVGTFGEINGTPPQPPLPQAPVIEPQPAPAPAAVLPAQEVSAPVVAAPVVPKVAVRTTIQKQSPHAQAAAAALATGEGTPSWLLFLLMCLLLLFTFSWVWYTPKQQ